MTGFLADYLSRRAEPGARLLVSHLDRLDEHRDRLLDCREPLLFVGAWRGMVYVGPFWTPGRPGCPRCLLTRTANSPFGPDLGDDGTTRPAMPDAATAALGPGVLAMVAQYVRRPPGEGQVVVVYGTTGTSEPQTLLPDSTCAICGVAAAGTLPELTDPGVPLTKIEATALRTGDPVRAGLAGDYLSPGLGLFKELRQDLQSPFGACSVELPGRFGRREPAIGRAGSYRTARTVAVLEGLERYAGLYRGGGPAVTRAAYADIADRALYPPSLGTHPDESYRSEGFRYRPFDACTVVDWVPAYSFRNGGPVLVPERAAFWGPRHDGEVSFFHDTSNGCALGGSVEEAIVHGLREVAERDAYLLGWYRKLALPEVEMAGADPGLDELLRKCRLFTGFEFRCFDSTMEYGLPSFWLVAENRRDDGPRVLTGSAAHPDPVRALTGGLHELVGIIQATTHGFAEHRADALRMLADPDALRRMPDHSLVGALPEARPRYAFLMDTRHGRTKLGEVARTVREDAADLRADLDSMVGGFLRAGLDVLALDQTMPELRRNGLHCVRVLVPGLVPMTFGHRNRRTEGLSRLTAGSGIPYRSLLAPDEEVGCIPHPFP
jgi:ribosomal protein S12 methylthiotransferase accessory factor